MAYRRSLANRASLLTRHRLAPSFLNTHSDDDRRRRQDPVPLHQRLFGTAVRSPLGFRHSQFSYTSPMASEFIGRNMSTAVGEGVDKIEYMTDVAEVLTDRTVEVVATAAPAVSEVAISAAPAVNEVAIAAADSAYPVAALQYLIDGVHNLTGVNWWASIALTTLLIRGATVPFLINQLKSTTKLSLLRPRLEELKQEMQEKGMDPKAVADGQAQMQALFKQYGVTPFTPLKGLLFQGPVFISFFFAISNMVEKVPSFKQGGAFWFTDLTTPDSLYICPALAALSFWITVECNMQEGMEGNPAAKTMKKVSRVFAALTIPVTMNFPKALFCYWVTSNIFSLMYGLVLKAPGVKKFLNIPEISVAPPSTNTTSSKPFSFFEAMKKYAAAKQNVATKSATSAQQAMSLPSETSKPAGIQNIPSSAVLSQRIRNLERQVKAKKKNKKR